MPPLTQDVKNINFLNEDVVPVITPSKQKKKSRIVWINLITFIIFHIGAAYGSYLMLFEIKWATFFFTYFVGICAGLGITAGAHRLWAHRTYKARRPLQILLLIFNFICIQGPVIEWVRDHRMHHKYSETDADPHNAKRGFFFSHIGWLLVRKHPEITAKGHTIDMSDVKNDPLLRFQKRYYLILTPIIGLVIPIYITTLWGESLMKAILTCGMVRCLSIWHFTYLVNSWAHLWGNKPYDKYINPVETKVVSLLALGEGHHNYHHTFPWDYKTAEGGGFIFNYTRVFIDFMAKIGWAYDLKTVPPEVIRKRVEKTGDGSHGVWGWNDNSISPEDRKAAIILNPDKNNNKTS